MEYCEFCSQELDAYCAVCDEWYCSCCETEHDCREQGDEEYEDD